MIRLPYLEWRAAGDDFGKLGAGRFRRRTPGKKGGLLLAGMVARTSTCLRRLAGGRRSGIVGFSRFLANPRVTVEALLDGWGAELLQGCLGRHILAIQDTSEFNFTTTKERSRGLGDLQLGALAAQNRKILAPIELERLSRTKGQRHKGAAPCCLLLTMPIGPPVAGKCRNPIIGAGEAKHYQIGM